MSLGAFICIECGDEFACMADADRHVKNQHFTNSKRIYHPPSLTEMTLVGRIVEDDGSTLYIFRKPKS